MTRGWTVLPAALLLLQASCIDEEECFDGDVSTTRVTSEIVDDTYELTFAIPDTCQGIHACALIVQLGDEDEALEVAEEAQDCGIPAIVVGVGYPGDGDDRERARDRDYTPVDDPESEYGGGGADAFLAFLEYELLPSIESTHGTFRRRVLSGSGHAGLLATYAMLRTDPVDPLFDGYIAASPSLWWADGVVFGYEEALARTETPLPVDYYVGVGELEGGQSVGVAAGFAERLQERGYSGLDVTWEVFDDRGRSGAARQSYRGGLHMLFGGDR